MVRADFVVALHLGVAEHALAVVGPLGALGAFAIGVGNRPRHAVGNHELVDAALRADHGLQAHAGFDRA